MSADAVQAISNYLADWAKRMGTNVPIEVVPNGVDIEKFQISDFRFQIETKKKVRQLLHIPEDVKVVITVSRLVKKNAVGDLIEAIKLLPDNVHLLVAGTGVLGHALKNLAHALGVGTRVHFLGNIENNDLPRYLWASDVFCRPSRSEGLGIAFLEAMAAGVPVVATRVGGIPDFLNDGETGVFCNVGDPRDIAEKIQKVLSDSALVEKFRTNGSRCIREKYMWDDIAARMHNIFDSVCAS